MVSSRGFPTGGSRRFQQSFPCPARPLGSQLSSCLRPLTQADSDQLTAGPTQAKVGGHISALLAPWTQCLVTGQGRVKTDQGNGESGEFLESQGLYVLAKQEFKGSSGLELEVSVGTNQPLQTRGATGRSL